MRAYDLILKKRQGESHNLEELKFLIDGYVAGAIADYQMAAWAMAVFFRGMEEEELAWLTQAMVESGQQVDLSAIQGVKVDKHSTGGVGDTTTLVLAPLVASAGVPVAKMSGRGLGHTGGTLDKLESFQGFRVDLPAKEFIEQVNRIKVAVIGQTEKIAPADGLLYGLRDVTATVDSIPLIASSVMSKKLASGADALVLDVKVGNGAFMKERDQALELAREMVTIGENLGKKTVAVLTAMDRPLGCAVGNALEAREAVEVLSGKGPADLRQLCLELGANMLVLAGREQTLDAARQQLAHNLDNGSALAKLKEMVTAQGGSGREIDNPELFPAAELRHSVTAAKDGWVESVETTDVGLAAQLLGAGRSRKGDTIDQAVGLLVSAKPGDQVKKGQSLVEIHANSEDKMEEAASMLAAAYRIGQKRLQPLPLICGRVSQGDGSPVP